MRLGNDYTIHINTYTHTLDALVSLFIAFKALNTNASAYRYAQMYQKTFRWTVQLSSVNVFRQFIHLVIVLFNVRIVYMTQAELLLLLQTPGVDKNRTMIRLRVLY